MRVRRCQTIVSVTAVLAAGVSGVRAEVVINTVTVGNPGNAPDTVYETPGYGGVDYVYSIGTYEVTVGQYTEFLNAVAVTDTYGLYNRYMSTTSRGCMIERTGDPGSYSYSAASDWAHRPVNFVGWGDSARFVNWLANGQPTGTQGPATTEDGSYYLNGAMTNAELLAVTRETNATWVIPTEDEWYKAAYHKNDGVTGNYWFYPTGTDSRLNNALIDPDPGNNANFEIGDGDYTIGSPYWRTDVGEFENSESPYGTFDQGGNVSEWNEAVLSGLQRGVRGGSFSLAGRMMHSVYRDALDPTFEHYDYGFRVAQVPEPATIVILALGSLAVLRRRRR